MDLTKLSKKELLAKCEENEIIKCKSKNKKELISLLQNKLNEPSINIDVNIEIKNICGIEYLKTITENSIDLILTDPPYIISKDRKSVV